MESQMADFVTFFTQLGFPAGVAVSMLWILYRVGMKLVDRHIKTLEAIEHTQTEVIKAIDNIQASQARTSEIQSRTLTLIESLAVRK